MGARNDRLILYNKLKELKLGHHILLMIEQQEHHADFYNTILDYFFDKHSNSCFLSSFGSL